MAHWARARHTRPQRNTRVLERFRLGQPAVAEAPGVDVAELLQLLAGQLIFFLDPHGYSIVRSRGSSAGSALVDLKRGDVVWRLTRDRGQVTIELRLDETREYPTYSTDILKRWLTGERDDAAALLTAETAKWLRDHLGEIEGALDSRRTATIQDWESLKKRRSKEQFG